MVSKTSIICAIQFVVIIVGLIQLLNNAILPAIISVFLVYLIGALEY